MNKLNISRNGAARSILAEPQTAWVLKSTSFAIAGEHMETESPLSVARPQGGDGTACRKRFDNFDVSPYHENLDVPLRAGP